MDEDFGEDAVAPDAPPRRGRAEQLGGGGCSGHRQPRDGLLLRSWHWRFEGGQRRGEGRGGSFEDVRAPLRAHRRPALARATTCWGLRCLSEHWRRGRTVMGHGAGRLRTSFGCHVISVRFAQGEKGPLGSGVHGWPWSIVRPERGVGGQCGIREGMGHRLGTGPSPHGAMRMRARPALH